MISEFKLGSKKYSVEYVDNIDDSGLGRCISPIGLIKIAKTFFGKDIPKDAQEQTTYHEIVHAILNELGQDKLSDDENFVQSFALLLHQFIITKK